MAPKSIIKILYITQHAEIGGGESVLLSTVSKLNKRKFEPLVIVPRKGKLFDNLKKLKIKTYILPLNPYFIRTLFIPGASLLGIFKLRQLVVKINPDLIHLNHLNFALYAGVAAKLSNIPIVATAHGPWDTINILQDIITNTFIKKILSPTQEIKKALLKKRVIKAEKIQVVPFGIDTTRFKKLDRSKAKLKLNLPKNSLIISAVGRIDPQKDQLNFLHAAQIANPKLKNAHFLIVGSSLGDFSGHNAYFQKIKDFLDKNPNLRKKVVLAGFRDDVPTAYQASDIFVSPSASESFGLSILEASASEIPVISTNKGNQQLTILNQISGYLIPPHNSKILAEKILTLANNPNLRNKMGKAGRNHVIENFQIKNYITRLENEYLKLASFKN